MLFRFDEAVKLFQAAQHRARALSLSLQPADHQKIAVASTANIELSSLDSDFCLKDADRFLRRCL